MGLDETGNDASKDAKDRECHMTSDTKDTVMAAGLTPAFAHVKTSARMLPNDVEIPRRMQNNTRWCVPVMAAGLQTWYPHMADCWSHGKKKTTFTIIQSPTGTCLKPEQGFLYPAL
jgi:hypothetical protein